jgi:type I restriction enzyme S subunit
MPKTKTQSLTLEERLAQALVPEDEQPYVVPSNWATVYLKEIVVNHDSKRIPLSQKQRNGMDKI